MYEEVNNNIIKQQSNKKFLHFLENEEINDLHKKQVQKRNIFQQSPVRNSRDMSQSAITGSPEQLQSNFGKVLHMNESQASLTSAHNSNSQQNFRQATQQIANTLSILKGIFRNDDILTRALRILIYKDQSKRNHDDLNILMKATEDMEFFQQINSQKSNVQNNMHLNLCKAFQFKFVQAGGLVFYEGGPSESFFITLKGQVCILIGRGKQDLDKEKGEGNEVEDASGKKPKKISIRKRLLIFTFKQSVQTLIIAIKFIETVTLLLFDKLCKYLKNKKELDSQSKIQNPVQSQFFLESIKSSKVNQNDSPDDTQLVNNQNQFSSQSESYIQRLEYPHIYALVDEFLEKPESLNKLKVFEILRDLKNDIYALKKFQGTKDLVSRYGHREIQAPVQNSAMNPETNRYSRSNVTNAIRQKRDQLLKKIPQFDIEKLENPGHYFDENIFRYKHIFNRDTGYVFGDIGIIHQKPRAATITCLQDTYFAFLSAEDYNRILKDGELVQINNQSNFIASTLSNQLSKDQLNKISLYFTTVKLKMGDYIAVQNNPFSHIYLIFRGEASVEKSIDINYGSHKSTIKARIGIIGPRQYVGDDDSYYNRKNIKYSVRVTSERLTCFMIQKKQFIYNIFEEELIQNEIISQIKMREFLRDNNLQQSEQTRNAIPIIQSMSKSKSCSQFFQKRETIKQDNKIEMDNLYQISPLGNLQIKEQISNHNKTERNSHLKAQNLNEASENCQQLYDNANSLSQKDNQLCDRELSESLKQKELFGARRYKGACEAKQIVKLNENYLQKNDLKPIKINQLFEITRNVCMQSNHSNMKKMEEINYLHIAQKYQSEVVPKQDYSYIYQSTPSIQTILKKIESSMDNISQTYTNYQNSQEHINIQSINLDRRPAREEDMKIIEQDTVISTQRSENTTKQQPTSVNAHYFYTSTFTKSSQNLKHTNPNRVLVTNSERKNQETEISFNTQDTYLSVISKQKHINQKNQTFQSPYFSSKPETFRDREPEIFMNKNQTFEQIESPQAQEGSFIQSNSSQKFILINHLNQPKTYNFQINNN